MVRARLRVVRVEWLRLNGKATFLMKIIFASILSLPFLGGFVASSFDGRPKLFFASSTGIGSEFVRHPAQFSLAQNDYQTDIDRLVALRSHPLDELIAVASQMESKWRRVDWNSYAGIMEHVCSEISNRGWNNERDREQSEHFARIALSHSNMYSWEHESMLVGWLAYQRTTSIVDDNFGERKEKAELWLHAWRRLERETDPNFDINDRKNLPTVRVVPPLETGLSPGAPPSAIKNPKLRAQYETAIAVNKRKAEKVSQQMPLLLHGPSFKARAERWLIQAYSQPPARNTELKKYLEIYVQDAKTRQRILSEVVRSSK